MNGIHPDPVLGIPASMVRNLLNYMAQRPWGEVNQAMEDLQSLQPIPQAPEQEQPAA